MFEIRQMESQIAMRYLVERHYLHRPIIKSRLIAHGVYKEGKLVGAVMWAIVHFTKKRGLFGFPDTLDKWEVLTLARFYLEPDSGLTASSVLSECIGKPGKGKRGSKRRGWRVQQDWCNTHPPRFTNEPFVPRLLISWADKALPPVENCPKCGGNHTGNHEGIIYKASGWEHWDTSTTTHVRSRSGVEEKNTGEGHKLCYILRLDPNPVAEQIGLERHIARNPQLSFAI